jgi:hypothetical protein
LKRHVEWKMGVNRGSGRQIQHTPENQVPIVKNQDGNRAEEAQSFDPVQLMLMPPFYLRDGGRYFGNVRFCYHVARNRAFSPCSQAQCWRAICELLRQPLTRRHN